MDAALEIMRSTSMMRVRVPMMPFASGLLRRAQ